MLRIGRNVLKRPLTRPPLSPQRQWSGSVGSFAGRREDGSAGGRRGVEFASSWTRWLLLFPLAVTGATLWSNAGPSNAECNGADALPFTGKQLEERLQLKIGAIRKQLRSSSSAPQPPELRVSRRGSVDEVQLTIPKQVDISLLLHHWSSVLPIQETSSTIFNGHHKLTMTCRDRRNKLVLETHPNADSVITLSTAQGLRAEEMDALVEGYRATWMKDDNNNNNSSKQRGIQGFSFFAPFRGKDYNDNDLSDESGSEGGNGMGRLFGGLLPKEFSFFFDGLDPDIRLFGDRNGNNRIWGDFFGNNMDPNQSPFSRMDEFGGVREDYDDRVGDGGDLRRRPSPPQLQQQQPSPSSPYQRGVNADPIEVLQSLGVTVYDNTANETANGQATTANDLDWDSLAGYQEIKDRLEDTIINTLKHGDLYDELVRKTRARFESNRPKAILFEGPPGTGKTLTARILASKGGRPLVHLRLENIVAKYYGESEKRLTQILDACDRMEGAIIFIDEVDGLVGNRDSGDMHEATRRILSVLLQRIEGFEGKGKSLVVCATNRKNDLDSALLSRFDLQISFPLPDLATRRDIFRRYAKQLESESQALQTVAAASEGFSCRDIKEACEQVERQWASRMIHKDPEALKRLPGQAEYLKMLNDRRASMGGFSGTYES